MRSQWVIATGSILLMLAIVLGAFGAHALKGRLSESMLTIYNTGVQYHFYHGLGLLMLGLIIKLHPGLIVLKWGVLSMVLGTVLFSGSLYALALTGVRVLGAVTPIGGVLLILAWSILAYAFIRVD